MRKLSSLIKKLPFSVVWIYAMVDGILSNIKLSNNRLEIKKKNFGKVQTFVISGLAIFTHQENFRSRTLTRNPNLGCLGMTFV